MSISFSKPNILLYLCFPLLVFLSILFNFPAFVYIILVLLTLLYPSRNSSNSIYDFPVICFFLFSGLSLLFRGFSFPDSIRILQFFGGSLVVVLLLLRTSFPIFYFRLFFILISFYESLHLLILKTHPSFFSIYFLRQDIDPLQRSLSLLEGFNRIYGPSFNSTVTGTVLGVFCFSMLFDRSNFFSGAPKIFLRKSSHILSFLVCFFSFLICQSGTAYLVFASAIFVTTIVNIYSSFLKVVSFRPLFISYRKAIVISLLSLTLYSLIRFFPYLFDRVSVDYFFAVFDTKVSQQAERLSSFSTLLFGTTDSSSFILGGDFLLLSFISGLGLLALFFFTFLIYSFLLKSHSLFRTASPHTSSNLLVSFISLTMLFVASTHYGVFFSIFSQIICASYITPQFYRPSQ